MLTHVHIWGAIDALAAAHGTSPSPRPCRPGLGATTSKKSKRSADNGRLRWPSTESISKVLEATNTTLEDFLGLVRKGAGEPARTIPLIGLAQAGDGGYFDDGGLPVGASWDEVAFPHVVGSHAYALEISGDSMLPVYRDGDIIIVDPEAPVRRGDRVVVKTLDGEVLAKELRRQTAKTIDLKSLNAEHQDRLLQMDQVAWVARILWISQ